MFYILNLIPIWIRIVVLAICEFIMVYSFFKYKNRYNKPFRNFFLLIIVFDPLFIITTILQESGVLESLIPSNFVEAFPVLISAAFGIGLIIAAIAHLRNRNLAQVQRSGLIIGLLMVAIGVLGFLLIELFM